MPCLGLSVPAHLPLLKKGNRLSTTPGTEDQQIDGAEDDDDCARSVVSENGKTITRLPSEEDLIGRRMNGLAGGLMGLGEGVRTP